MAVWITNPQKPHYLWPTCRRYALDFEILDGKTDSIAPQLLPGQAKSDNSATEPDTNQSHDEAQRSAPTELE